MTNKWFSLGAVLAATLAASGASAQIMGPGWGEYCIEYEDDGTTNAYSDDYGIMGVGNNLIVARMGVSGTVVYGACYEPDITYDAPGRFAFMVGGVGSVQSSFDNNLALTWGAPLHPVGDFAYARIIVGTNEPVADESVLFGDGGLRGNWVGASQRYMVAVWGDDAVDVEVQTRVIGDAARIRWRITNLAEEATPLGLYWAAYAAMRNASAVDDIGTNTSQTPFGELPRFRNPVYQQDRYIGWNLTGVGKPLRTEHLYRSNRTNFPARVDLLFSQNEPYGLRIDNLPGADTNDATASDLFVVGNYGDLRSPGLIRDNTLRPAVFGDPTGTVEEADIVINETAYIQRFPARSTAPGAVREIVHYVRSPWAVGDYNDPYTALVDAPRIVGASPTNPNVLTPNPMQIVAYVDNQYARIDRDIELRNVRFTITLPNGFSLAPGEQPTKVIASIAPNAVNNVTWQVRVDEPLIGRFNYSVTIQPTPGPTKVLTGTIEVGAIPQLRLAEGPNLVSIPYEFADSSFEKILGLTPGLDFTAYRWSPDQLAYLPASTAERGAAYWVIPNNDLAYRQLQGAQLPGDMDDGGGIFSLQQGWNLIGNPYNYPIQISQLVAVAEDAPQDALTWQEVIDQGFVSSSFVYFDRTSGTYRFTSSTQEYLRPHTGYWLYVSTFRPIRVSWPGVYFPDRPGAMRSVESPWLQSERNWRLQLTARTADGMDAENFVGVSTDAKTINRLRMPKPPMPPEAKVQLSIEGEMAGQTLPMATAVDTRNGKRDWTIRVRAEEPGEITVTWPNLPSLPRNVRARITDPATGVSKDLRAVSGYTFTMAQAGERVLTLTTDTGGAARAVIGNVVVGRNGRDANSPVTLTYALSADALVSVRILNGSGKEVYTASRGRAESAGENTVTWMLRDNANRSVAPGVYRAEILAETPTGERVRKIVPINVTR